MDSSCSQNKSRFCYSYKPPGIIKECCDPVVCTTNEFISSISSLSMVTYNNTRTTEQSLLLASQQLLYQENYNTAVTSTLQYISTNDSIITSTIYGQILQVGRDRYLPYQPYIPECLPPSVIQLQMNTVNVGVPMPVFTIANCKGSQSVTTSNVITY
jgi:hypothetical protein